MKTQSHVMSTEVSDGFGREVAIVYTNHRGETDTRRIIPLELVFGSTPYHPEPQWLLRAIALDRGEERHFACSNIHSWGQSCG
jgi:predicted DNA-binding transcriptional regulator YafY